MNKKLIVLIAVAISGFTYLNFAEEEFRSNNDNDPNNDLVAYSSDVKTIIDNSCIGCHNSESKNTKGKKKLNFDSFNNGDYSKGKAVGKLNGIIKTMKKESMPPKKFLNKYPEKKIAKADAQKLKDWANESAEKLMN